MAAIDHIGVAARDARATACDLAELLGAPSPVTDGADDDMYRVDFEHGASILFSTSTGAIPSEHIAFRVERARFAEVVARLRARGQAFGNDPENPANGETSDPLGGSGRVYFHDENGHLFEVVCFD